MSVRPERLYLTTDAVGGVWTYSLDLARALTSAGTEVILATQGPAPDAAQRAEAEAIAGLRLVEADAPLDWLESDEALLEAGGSRLAEQAADLGADLVHLNSPGYAPAPFRAPVVAGCHSCVASWWAAVKSAPMPPDFRRQTERLARGYHAATAMVAPSRAFARETARLYGVQPAAIWNGRSPGGRCTDSVKAPQAITAGRLWDEGKNLATLDAAAALIDRPVLAAGPLRAPQGGAVAPCAVQPLGALPSGVLDDHLNRSAAFVSLAVYEPFGYAVLEAAQSGCALILSDIPTFRELWSGAAIFVRPRASLYAAGVIDAVLSDPAECARLGRLAAARAERYGLDAMGEGMLRLYAQVLSRQIQGAAA